MLRGPCKPIPPCKVGRSSGEPPPVANLAHAEPDKGADTAPPLSMPAPCCPPYGLLRLLELGGTSCCRDGCAACGGRHR